MEIGFIGLGKLGMPCAEVMAERHNVAGYDIAIRESESITIVDNIKDTVIDKDFTFVAIQTPHDPAYDGRYPSSHLPPKDFDYSHVKNVLKQLYEIDHKSTIVLISTVLPGTIRREFLKYIRPGQFLYNPYLIAMGTVKEDMRNPEMVIIGNESGYPTAKLSQLVSFYHSICECYRYIIGTWDEAESIKIFYNTFISMKLAITNMVLDVAEKNGNIDADVVMGALSHSTKRLISPMYMKPGMGDGGPCHPRDNIALSSLAERLDLGYDLFQSIMISREEQAHNLALKLTSYRLPIVILGKSYKPNVDFVDGSYSILVGDYAGMEGGEVYFDENPDIDGPFVYLLAHKFRHFDFDFKTDSIIVDPWGDFSKIGQWTVVRYGRT